MRVVSSSICTLNALAISHVRPYVTHPVLRNTGSLSPRFAVLLNVDMIIRLQGMDCLVGEFDAGALSKGKDSINGGIVLRESFDQSELVLDSTPLRFCALLGSIGSQLEKGEAVG